MACLLSPPERVLERVTVLDQHLLEFALLVLQATIGVQLDSSCRLQFVIQLVALQLVDNLVIQIGLRAGFSTKADECGGYRDLVKRSPAGECGIRQALECF